MIPEQEIAYIPLLLGLDLTHYPPQITDSIQRLSAIDFSPYPGIKNYLERLQVRPAFREIIGDRNYQFPKKNYASSQINELTSIK